MSGPGLWGKGEMYNITRVREIGNFFEEVFDCFRKCIVIANQLCGLLGERDLCCVTTFIAATMNSLAVWRSIILKTPRTGFRLHRPTLRG